MKIRIFVLAAVLAAMLSVAVYAADQAEICVISEVHSDTCTVNVAVELKASVPIYGYSFNLGYDNSAVTLKSARAGEAYTSAAAVVVNESFAENAVRTVCASANAIPSEGTVLEAEFEYDADYTGNIAFEIERHIIYGEESAKLPSLSHNGYVEINGEKKDPAPSGGKVVIIRPDDEEETTDTESGIEQKETESEEDPEVFLMSFCDVGEKDWFYDSVEFVTRRGIMNGVSEELFAPAERLTRAMLVTVLYRMDGEPEVTGKAPFNDTEDGAYYESAVIWAYNNGVVNGVSENEFAPDKDITREQIATVFYRYAAFKGYTADIPESIDTSTYSDHDSVSEYAVDAMKYVLSCGIIKGKTASSICPADNATRAEAATVLMRFFEFNGLK